VAIKVGERIPGGADYVHGSRQRRPILVHPLKGSTLTAVLQDSAVRTCTLFGNPSQLRRFRRNSRISVLFCILMAIYSVGSRVQAQTTVMSSPEAVAALNLVVGYLNNMSTMTARITQRVIQKGHVVNITNGRLWIERPGKLRAEFGPPNPYLYVSDGYYLFYDDMDVNEVIPKEIRSTPFWFLLSSPMDLSSVRVVVDVDQIKHLILVTPAENSIDYTVTLYFKEEPLGLIGWGVRDPQGRQSIVLLSDIRMGVSLDPTLFQGPTRKK
jgi:outer membrane lipoprotein-sorting protein